MKYTFDCIIPYCNEALRPLSVVASVLNLRNINRVITVDDGSSEDTTYKELKLKFPDTTSFRLESNCGKTKAVREGLKYAVAPYILLMDGDLTNIRTDELENACVKITSNPWIDMIIFRRVEDKTVIVSHWLRHDIIFSGQRILRRSDLENSMDDEVAGYNMESAINSYMIKNHKRVYWMPLSVHNLFKHEKWGYTKGILKVGIPAFIGFMCSSDIICQTLFFCRHKAPELQRT